MFSRAYAQFGCRSLFLVSILILCLQGIISVFVLLSVVFHHCLFFLLVLYPYLVFDCLSCYAPAASIVIFAGVLGGLMLRRWSSRSGFIN